MVPNIEIIVGTYEEFLLGYKFEDKEEKPTLIQSFADKSHAGSIKCLAVQDHWIATGSTDDRIFVYDMRTRKQTEIIIAHEGTINALTFAPDSSQLFSGGGDGCMIATQVGQWKTSASWKKAHGGSALTHISCHPSGKLALSLGSDLILRTWNLVKGRVAYKSNLKSRSSLGRIADCLSWSPGGNFFSLTGQRIVEIWSIEKADVVYSKKTAAKPISMCWISEDACLVGLEDGKILFMSTVGQEKEDEVIEAHPTRVKAMAVLGSTLVTASSCGEIKVWHINENEMKLKEISTANIGCRPTCLGILDLTNFESNFKLDANAEDNKETVKKSVKKPKRVQGVVTVEYENEDSEDDGTSHDREQNHAQSSDESEEVENEQTSEEDSVNSEQDSDEDDEEVQQKTKKRKLKQHKNEVKKSKQTKFNTTSVKPQGKILNQNKRKTK